MWDREGIFTGKKQRELSGVMICSLSPWEFGLHRSKLFSKLTRKYTKHLFISLYVNFNSREKKDPLTNIELPLMISMLKY